MVYRLADNIYSPLGETTEQNYQAVKAGCSALCSFSGYLNIPEPFTASLFREQQNEAFAVEGLTRFESLAYTSAKKAIEASEVDVTAPNVVFILSTTKGNIELISHELTDDTILYPGTAAQHIAQRLGVTTMPITVCNACISGVSAMILALRLLEAKDYDYAIVCGADIQNKFTISGFQSLKAVSEKECKPFDIERMGLNLGEAAATIILTRYQVADGWAIERGAVRNDAFHISSPSKNGEGARLALNAIVSDTNLEKLAFINAHGTATMFNDQMESVAIERAGMGTIPVNALKGFFGHTLGAAGVLETIISIASAEDHTILATKGFDEIGVSGKIQVVSQNTATEKTSFIKMISGFGGCNGAIEVSKYVESEAESLPSRNLYKKHHVLLAQSGLFIDGKRQVCSGTGKALIADIYKRDINDYPKFYKMDGLSRLGFVASELLVRIDGETDEYPREDRAVILFNRSSSIQADKYYQTSIQDTANYFPSPAAFVYTLPNIVTGEIAIRHQYYGETSFYILPEKDNNLIDCIMMSSFGDLQTKSILGGWVDYQDDDHFEADLYIVENK